MSAVNFENDIWEESDVQGFNFDDIETKDVQFFSDALAKNLSGTTVEANFLPSLIDEDCTFCNRKLVTVAKYESQSSFCSEKCWTDCVRTSLSDLRCGGISSWPISMFTSLSAKRLLVKLAIETLDGDFLLKVMLLIEARLDQNVFFSIILENDLSCNHYLNFLKQTEQTAKADALMQAQAKTEEAKLVLFKQHIDRLGTVSHQEAEKLLHTIRLFAITELSITPQLLILHESTLQAADLLQFQINTNPEWLAFLANSKSNESNAAASHINELSGTLIGQNLANTILACAYMDKKVSSESRAAKLKVKHSMSDEHFRWLVLESLVVNQLWIEMDMLLFEKKWMSRKVSVALPVDRLILFLHSKKAPKHVIRRFIPHLLDSEEVINILARIGAYDLGIEHFVRRRDVSGLKALIQRTPMKSPLQHSGQEYLSKPTNQWKEYCVAE